MTKNLLSRFKVILIISLLTMLLLRTVWMQLRTYNADVNVRTLITAEYMYSAYGLSCKFDNSMNYHNKNENLELVNSIHKIVSSRASEILIYASCSNGNLSYESLKNWNQWIVIITIFFSILSTRLIASNWIIAIMAGLIVLSRGDILSRIGYFTPDSLIMMLVSLIFFLIIYFWRNGSIKILLLLLCLLCISQVINSFLAIIGYAFITVTILGQLFQKKAYSLYGTSQKTELPKNSFTFSFLFSHKKSVFCWLYTDNKNLSKMYFALCGYFIFSLALLIFSTVAYIKEPAVIALWNHANQNITDLTQFTFYFKQWAKHFYYMFDIHLLISLFFIILGIFLKPKFGLKTFFEISILFILILGTLFAASYSQFVFEQLIYTSSLINSFFALQLTPPTNILIWCEPILLILGLLGLQHFYKITWVKNNRHI